MWFFWVYVLLGAWEKTKSYKIFTNFWFRIFSYTFWGLILVKIWWKFTCKKNLESLFWPESKIHLIQIEVIDIAHILYELDFWFRQNSDPEIFLRWKKYPASVPKSVVVKYCFAILWLEWKMNKGQNTDLPEAKWLNYIIPQLFWSIDDLGPLFSTICV